MRQEEPFGSIIAFGIEGTGSYGSPLASLTRLYRHKVVKVNRADPRLRPFHGKSDTLNAVNAARAMLSRNATAIPKSADGTVEIACETASKYWSVTMVTLKSLLVNAPERLQLEGTTMSQLKLARLLATLRPRSLDTPQDSLPRIAF